MSFLKKYHQILIRIISRYALYGVVFLSASFVLAGCDESGVAEKDLNSDPTPALSQPAPTPPPAPTPSATTAADSPEDELDVAETPPVLAARCAGRIHTNVGCVPAPSGSSGAPSELLHLLP